MKTIFAVSLIVAVAGSVDPTVGELAFMLAVVIAVGVGIRNGARSSSTPVVITRMPTRHEQSRWVPGVGVGVSLWRHGLRPFAVVTAHRWRR